MSKSYCLIGSHTTTGPAVKTPIKWRDRGQTQMMFFSISVSLTVFVFRVLAGVALRRRRAARIRVSVRAAFDIYHRQPRLTGTDWFQTMRTGVKPLLRMRISSYGLPRWIHFVTNPPSSLANPLMLPTCLFVKSQGRSNCDVLFVTY